MEYETGEHVLACVHGTEFTGEVKTNVDEVYWIVCDDCGKTHVALAEEMESLSEPNRTEV